MPPFIQTLPKTFYSQPFYASLILRGKGIGWGYIFSQGVLLFAAVLLSVLLGPPSLPAAQRNLNAFFEQFPGITIEGQKLSLDRPSPISVEMSITDHKSYVVFDTTPREKDAAKIAEELKSKRILVLVTSDFVAVPKTGRKVTNGTALQAEFFDFAGYDKKSLNITHDDWVSFGKRILPMAGVLSFIQLFARCLFATFLAALFVKMFSLFFTTKPNFSSAMRLSAAAAIPASFLALPLVPFHMSVSFSVGIIFTLAFAVFGFISADKELNEQKAP